MFIGTFFCVVCVWLQYIYCYVLSQFSHVWLFVTPWTVPYQAPLSMESPRPEYWNGLLFPSPGNLSDPGVKPVSPASPTLEANSLPWAIQEAHLLLCAVLNHFNHVPLFAILWTVTHQVPLSMRFSKQGYWSGLPCLPLGNLPNPGIEPMSPALAVRFSYH